MEPKTLQIIQSIVIAVLGLFSLKLTLSGKKEDSHVSDNKTITELFNIQAKSIDTLTSKINEQSKIIDDQTDKISEQSQTIKNQQDQIKKLTDQVLILNTKLGIYEKGESLS